jgi:hypothetical protein
MTMKKHPCLRLLCSSWLLLVAFACQGSEGTAPRSVEQLPVDKFDTYPADAPPPFPWRLLGDSEPGVRMELSSEYETPFVGNKETGKAFVLEDRSTEAGAGSGLAMDFAPPPRGRLYLGFDFCLQPSGVDGEGVSLRCAWVDAEDAGLHLSLSVDKGLWLRTQEGEHQLVPGLLAGHWYHLGVTWKIDGQASVALYSEDKPSVPMDLGAYEIGLASLITQLRFQSGPDDEATGSWAVDNVCLAGRVDAPRRDWLPFAQDSLEELRASPRKVFAYYYPIYSSGASSGDTGLSWYVRSLLNPTLNKDKARAKAGTRTFYYPLPRPPLDAGLDESEEMALAREDEVRLGVEMGLDGFIVDFFSAPTRQGGQVYFNKISFSMMEAADAIDDGFKIIPAVYTGSEVKQLLEEGRVEEAAGLYASSEVFALLQHYKCLYRTPEGKMLFSMWLPERHSAAFWEQVLAKLDERGIPATFLAQFNSRNHLDAFAPFSFALANWGPRTPIKTGWIAQARGYAPLVVAPIAGLDVRTRGNTFWESANFDTLRNSWKMAIEEGADWAEINTWSDYSEQALAPSTAIGFACHDLNTYYTQWFKTGKQPEIIRDTLYYSYRINHTGIDPGRGVTWKMQAEGGFAEPKNEIELLALLKAPGTLEIRVADEVYRQEAPAGITSFKVPLPEGVSFTPVFGLRRDGQTVLDEPGRYTVLDQVEYPDLLYHSGVITR